MKVKIDSSNTNFFLVGENQERQSRVYSVKGVTNNIYLRNNFNQERITLGPISNIIINDTQTLADFSSNQLFLNTLKEIVFDSEASGNNNNNTPSETRVQTTIQGASFDYYSSPNHSAGYEGDPNNPQEGDIAKNGRLSDGTFVPLAHFINGDWEFLDSITT